MALNTQPALAPPPVCYNCNKVGHKRPECPELKSDSGSRVTNPASTSSSKGPTMVTRGRAHQLTAEEPAITPTGTGNSLFHPSLFLYCLMVYSSLKVFCAFIWYESNMYLLNSQTAATAFDSSAIHSFVARIFINRIGRCVGKLARPMVTKVADYRMI